MFDPNPPYSILRSADIEYAEIEKLRGVSKLLDLLVNSGRFNFFMSLLINKFGSLAACLDNVDRYWRKQNLYQGPKPLREIYLILYAYLQQSFSADTIDLYSEALARDYAHNERVVAGSAPPFFNVDLSDEEQEALRKRVKQEVAQLERSGKVQFFAAVFNQLPEIAGRVVVIFLYLSKTGKRQRVKEVVLS